MSNQSNSAHNIDALISGIMRDDTTSNNRQASLIVAMFESEITFSTGNILTLFRKTGKDMTTALDKELSALSDTYADTLATYADFADMDNAARSEKDKFTMETLSNKLKAAREMFKRSARAVYGLRVSNAERVSVSNKGAGAILVRRPHKEMKDTFIVDTLSGRQLTSAGAAALNKALNKGRATSASNPSSDSAQARSLSDSSKALSALLTSQAKNGKRIPMSDYDDTVERQLETTLRELFLAKFVGDDGLIDEASVHEYVTAYNEQRIAARQAKNKPADKPAAANQRNAA